MAEDGNDSGSDHERLDSEWKYDSIWDAEDWDDDFDDEWLDYYELKWTKEGLNARLVIEVWRVVESTDTTVIYKMDHVTETSIKAYPARYLPILLAEKNRVEANEVPRNIFLLLEDEEKRCWRLDCLYADILPRPPITLSDLIPF